MANLQENLAYRVRGTFIEVAVLSWEKEKERVTQSRSHSLPASFKACNYHHACVERSASKRCHDATTRNSDVRDSDIVEELSHLNTPDFCMTQTNYHDACVKLSASKWCDLVDDSTTATHDSDAEDLLSDAHDSDIMDELNHRDNPRPRMTQMDQCSCCGVQGTPCACDNMFSSEDIMLSGDPPGRCATVVEGRYAVRAPAQDQDEQFEDDMTICKEGFTVMLCNLPRRATRVDIVEALKSHGFGDSYNFVDLPKGRGRRNVGYAFINLTSKDVGDRFAKAFEDFQFPGVLSTKKCAIKFAYQQGCSHHAAK